MTIQEAIKRLGGEAMSIDQDKIEQELEKEFEQYAQLMEEIRTHPNCDFADGLIRPLYDKLWQSLLTARRESAETNLVPVEVARSSSIVASGGPEFGSVGKTSTWKSGPGERWSGETEPCTRTS